MRCDFLGLALKMDFFLFPKHKDFSFNDNLKNWSFHLDHFTVILKTQTSKQNHYLGKFFLIFFIKKWTWKKSTPLFAIIKFSFN